MIAREILKQLRKQYVKGARVRLERMEDFQAPPIGTLGTVTRVDDAGSIHVNWDNGSTLAVIHGVDYCSIV